MTTHNATCSNGHTLGVPEWAIWIALLDRMLWRAGAGLALLTVVIGSAWLEPAQAGEPSGGLVYLSDIAPSIRQDMRYAGANNFTGGPVPGYEANACLLLLPVAVALARVQAALERQQLSLVVYDCYRPERSVRAFVDWAGRPEDGATKHHYPRYSRNQLFDLGYIARSSGHSRGNAVDVSIIESATGSVAAPEDGPTTVPCTAPAAQRARDSTIDMGTTYDCFDPASHTDAEQVSAAARRWRKRLQEAMSREGFRNYSREWWHFSLGAGSGPFDVPVRAKGN